MNNNLLTLEKEFGLKLNEKGEIVVDSITIAKKYGKNHRDVTRKIDGFIKLIPELGVRNFTQTSYVAENGETYRMYIMNRQGFSILVNKFTGDKALKFTVKYTQAFEEMAKEIKELKQDNKELYNTAVSDKDLADRQYQADRVHYAINNIEKRLLECDYTNIVATVDKIIDVHTNLYVKDRYKPHQDTDKYGGKGSSLYVNHVKGIIENKLDKIRPQMTLRDSNINSIILSKARQLHKEIESSKNITDGKIKSNLEKENKQLLTVIDSSIVYPRQSEFVVLDYHGFSENYMYTNIGDNIVKTDVYKNWIRYFPREDVPELEYWNDVDFTKPIELFINYVSKSNFDVKNLDKSFIDMIFNRIYKVDDNIVQAVHSQRVETCNWFEDGKIGFYIRNL